MRRVVVLLLMGLLWAAPARADLLLAGTIGVTSFCASDNNLGCTFGSILLDQDPTLGRLSLDNAIIEGVDIQGSLHTQTVGTQNILNSSSLLIENTTGSLVNAIIAVGGTGFVGPVSEAETSGSGTWENAAGSTILMNWFNDPANGQGAQTPSDTPGLLVDTFTYTALAGVDSFNHDGGPIPVNDPGLFSMTLQFSLGLQPGASLISRGMTEVKNQDIAPIPEPGSMILLGTGLFALAARLRRKR
jgi:hypothetical protein